MSRGVTLTKDEFRRGAYAKKIAVKRTIYLEITSKIGYDGSTTIVKARGLTIGKKNRRLNDGKANSAGVRKALS